jgi:hypothetical protein
MVHDGRMKELAGRLTALDPDAGAAVQVIAYFDRLVEARAGVESLVRGAALLAGCPARLVDHERQVRVRVEEDGTRSDTGQAPDPAWPSRRLSPDGSAALWLERAGLRPSVVDAVILERAAGAAREVLDRTRGRAPADDPALLETVLDPRVPEQARLHAARRLGLDPAGAARILAPLGGPPRVEDELSARRNPTPPLPEGRWGLGPVVPVADLPRSWDAARTALRFTAEGTADDPGPRVVDADELGGIALLIGLVGSRDDGAPADVREIEAAAVRTPWLIATLQAFVTGASLRAAAAELNVHHSTLQDRLAHAERLLGWPVRTPQGRFRVQLALTLRRLGRVTG